MRFNQSRHTSHTNFTLWHQFRHCLALFAILFLALSSAAHAQVSATMNGTVTDSTGAVIPGAKVILTNDATQEMRTTVSNGEGYFVFPALLSGSYSVRIDANGFKAYTQRGIPLNAGDVR